MDYTENNYINISQGLNSTRIVYDSTEREFIAMSVTRADIYYHSSKTIKGMSEYIESTFTNKAPYDLFLGYKYGSLGKRQKKLDNLIKTEDQNLSKYLSILL